MYYYTKSGPNRRGGRGAEWVPGLAFLGASQKWFNGFISLASQKKTRNNSPDWKIWRVNYYLPQASLSLCKALHKIIKYTFFFVKNVKSIHLQTVLDSWQLLATRWFILRCDVWIDAWYFCEWARGRQPESRSACACGVPLPPTWQRGLSRTGSNRKTSHYAECYTKSHKYPHNAHCQSLLHN